MYKLFVSFIKCRLLNLAETLIFEYHDKIPYSFILL